MKIAFYLRLSIADGDLGKNDKDESNSIENQRILLQTYLKAKELPENDIAEYIDDGYSGLNFDRPAFQRMIEDAKQGKIDTILVKDLSRLGRDYICVGDYLEQIFPVLGIRFIAVNTNYDSNQFLGKTMGLEMSIGNLINTLYSKDLSKKYKTAIQTKWKQGISTSGFVPFGYLKETNSTHKWMIDPVAGKYVRLIFDLAIQGYTTKMIAEHLNEHDIPTPGKYRVMRSGSGCWNRIVSDHEWLWETEIVWRVLKNYSYTGALVHGKTTGITVGGRERRTTNKKDQFIVENVHPAIVTVEEFEKAQETIRSIGYNSIRQDAGDVLVGKIRCGNCKLTMYYANSSPRILLCRHKASSGRKSSCSDRRYESKMIEGQVWFALRKQIELLKKLATLAEDVNSNTHTGIEAEKKQLKRSIEDLKAERIRSYENFVNGHMTKEAYMNFKSDLNEKIEKMSAQLGFLQGESDTEDNIIRELSELKQKAEETEVFETLTRSAVRTFIDTVYIHSADQLEIKFLFDDVIERTVAYIEQHTNETVAVV